jgi:hypothetical protein
VSSVTFEEGDLTDLELRSPCRRDRTSLGVEVDEHVDLVANARSLGDLAAEEKDLLLVVHRQQRARRAEAPDGQRGVPSEELVDRHRQPSHVSGQNPHFETSQTRPSKSGTRRPIASKAPSIAGAFSASSSVAPMNEVSGPSPWMMTRPMSIPRVGLMMTVIMTLQ